MSISWDREAAAHLARRAGFGATPAELDTLVTIGADAAVDQFVNYDGIDNSALETALQGLAQVGHLARAQLAFEHLVEQLVEVHAHSGT